MHNSFFTYKFYLFEIQCFKYTVVVLFVFPFIEVFEIGIIYRNNKETK